MRSLSLDSAPPASTPSLGPSGAPVAASGVEKRPLRLIRHSLERFAKVIELELENASRHEAVLTQLLQERSRGGQALRRELAGASACLQRLRDHLRQLEKLRRAVLQEDLPRFDETVAEHEALARERLLHFAALYERSRSHRLADSPSPTREEGPDLPKRMQLPQEVPAVETSSEGERQLQLQVNEEEEDSEDEAMLEAWDQLADDLENLEQLMAELGQQVHEQNAAVDSIAGNVESSRGRVLSGVRNLASAAKLKYAMAPIAGAAVGSLVAGPVGFIVGAKMGAAAGMLGGGVVGLASGGLARKIHMKRVQTDMIEMETKLQEGEQQGDVRTEES